MLSETELKVYNELRKRKVATAEELSNVLNLSPLHGLKRSLPTETEGFSGSK